MLYNRTTTTAAVHEDAPKRELNRKPRRARQHLLALTLALPILAALSITSAAPASAAGPIAHNGDLLLVTDGGLLSGVGIDRIDPRTAKWERSATFPSGENWLNSETVAPDGTWIVYAQGFRRIDPTNGQQTLLPTPSTKLGNVVLAIAADSDGTVVVLHFDETSGIVALSRYNTKTGAVRTITNGGQLGLPGIPSDQLVIESDGDLLVAKDSSLIRVSDDGKQTAIHKFPATLNRTLALSPAGELYSIRTDDPFGKPMGVLTRLNPETGVETTITKNADLARPWAMTVGADGSIYAAGTAHEDKDTRRIAQINPTTGTYRAIRDVGQYDAKELAVAGRNQVPVRPVAASDTYDVDEGQTLQVTNRTTSVLANDHDGLGNPMITARLIGSTHKGDLKLNSDGTFTYTPAAFSTGTDTFTYEATDLEGNRSHRATATIRIHSLSPLAAPDSYRVPPNKAFTTGTAGRPSVLANDQNPGGKLEVLTLTKPTHGTLKLGNDGNFTYTPKTGYTGTDKFTYQLYNGTDFSFPTDVTLTVKA